MLQLHMHRLDELGLVGRALVGAGEVDDGVVSGCLDRLDYLPQIMVCSLSVSDTN